jgi:hypothetical protein
MMDRDLRPQDMVPPLTMLRWLASETLRGNVAPWAHIGRTFRLGQRILRQQAILDRALAQAERGGDDHSLPMQLSALA